MMGENRIPPADADDYLWDKFEVWADSHDVGSHVDDWTPWWECWCAGLLAMVA